MTIYRYALCAAMSILSMSGAWAQTYTYEDKLAEAFNHIMQRSIERVEGDKLVDAAIEGMLSALDPHSRYWSAKESEYGTRTFMSGYQGYGLELKFINDTLTVVGMECDGPADNAGMYLGDKVLGISNRQTSGCHMTRHELELLMAEQPARTIFHVISTKQNKARHIYVTRGRIQQRTVTDAFLLQSGVAIIGISEFKSPTSYEFKKALTKLTKSGAKSLILDLRGNAGGSVRAAEEILSMIMPEGTSLYATIDNQGHEEWTSTCPTDFHFDGKVIILSNSNSASASELVMSVVQDNDRGIIVGRPSFGKSLIQDSHTFPDQSILDLSSYYWVTLSGRNIQRDYSRGVKTYRDRAAYLRTHIDEALPPVDSKPYHTQSGRVVYAHCGITPDVVVRHDTLSDSYLLWQMIDKDLPNIVTAKMHQSMKGLPEKASDIQLAERIRFEASKMGIRCTQEQVVSSQLLMNYFRSFIRRRRNCATSIVNNTYQYDQDILSALRLLHDDGAEYSRILTHN